MKMITAIIKPFKLDEVREALSAINVQVQDVAIAHFLVVHGVQVAAVLAVLKAEQVGRRVRVFQRERAVAELAVHFESVGAVRQAVGWVVEEQAART